MKIRNGFVSNSSSSSFIVATEKGKVQGRLIGFDSCSAPKFEAAIKNISGELNEGELQRYLSLSESCESSLFSAYINVLGEYWNCSFSENELDWKPVNVLEFDSFIDVWHSTEVKRFREKLLATEVEGCRHCVTFPEIN